MEQKKVGAAGRRGYRRAAALLLSIAVLASACGGRSLKLETPELPEWWLSEYHRLRYEIRWIDENGSPRELSCAPGRSVPVAIPRLTNTPVLVVPALETNRGTRRLLPGGALYPQDLCGSNTLRASWRRGFEARLFLALQERRSAYFRVNQPRLEVALRSRCGDDPWRADIDLVAARLARGSFRESYLSPRDTVGVMATAPPGSYLSENLLRRPVETRLIGSEHALVLERLYPGNHRYFHAGGKVGVVVSNDGEHRPTWAFLGRWR